MRAVAEDNRAVWLQLGKARTTPQNRVRQKWCQTFERQDMGMSRTILAAAVATSMGCAASAATVEFHWGDALAPGGVLLPGGAVATGEILTFGTGAGVEGRTGAVQENLGGNFDGEVFDALRPNVSALGTLIQATRAADIDTDVGSDPYTNAIGLHVSFSQAQYIDFFYALDIDGGSRNGEWFTSFAYNGGDLVEPTITLADTSDLGIVSGVSSTRVFPGTLNIVENQTATVGLLPGAPETQAQFFVGQEITEITFVWGVHGDLPETSTSFQNSGVSSLVIESDPIVVAPVPLPASLGFMVAGLGALGAFRLRKGALAA